MRIVYETRWIKSEGCGIADRKVCYLVRDDLTIPRDIRPGEFVRLPGVSDEDGSDYLQWTADCYWTWDAVAKDWVVEIHAMNPHYVGDTERQAFDAYVATAKAAGWSEQC